MDRNANNHFSINPSIDIQRSRFKMPHQHKTTFSTGSLIPLYHREILPGDTVTMDMSAAMRMSTPIYPVMDNASFDYFWYFVPYRLLWTHFREFMGENRLTAWEQPIEYEVPQITAPAKTGWTKGSIADYMGIPTKTTNLSVSHLPFRAYCLIWNEWFRSTALKDAAMINDDETTLTGTNDGDYVQNAQLGAKPLKVAKFFDMFTGALPEPQLGEDVLLPLGNIAPVIGNGNTLGWDALRDNEIVTMGTRFQSSDDLYWRGVGGEKIGEIDNENDYATDGQMIGISQNPEKSGLIADLSQAQAASVNALRQAFAIQRHYEKLARGGNRYRDQIKTMFGVTSSDARMQIPEYLGGFRHPINIDQVLQTSATNETSPQGNTAAYSLTNFVDNVFTKSFEEHGILMCVGCVRTEHTYQQGLEACWSRKSLFDFYFPTFANLGEMPIYNKEIYAQGTKEDDEVFGYQEAWASYRYHPSRVSGAFRSNYEQTLDSWHYADYYEKLPRLSGEWIDETTANMNRTIAVSDELEDQFIADFYFDATFTRPMPLYSIPGLIDHN